MPRLSLGNAFPAAVESVDRKVQWHRLPGSPGLVTLIGIRDQAKAVQLRVIGEPPTEHYRV
jgi:hypothetical protein